MTSLITAMRTQFLEAIRSVNPPGRWKILVVDEHSQALLSATLKQFDILEENVTLIESITTNREPQPQFEAVYILMATTQNAERVVRDFSGKQQYAAAHLFFIDGLSEALLNMIASSPAEPFLGGVKDLFINYWPIESQAFSVKLPGTFFSMYGPPRNDAAYTPLRNHLEEELQFTARIISNVCISLNEYPYVRYYLPTHHAPLGPLKPHASTRPPPPAEGASRWRTNLARGSEARAYESADSDYVTKVLALMVQDTLDEYKRSNPDFPKADSGRPRATLIITDRSMDTVSPFLHEFTYQAMANDLLPIEDGSKYTYKFQTAIGAFEDKTATISDADATWTEIRHMHMADAINKLMSDFNQFMVDNAGFKGDGAASLSDMKDMLASLPQYQEQRERFSLHLNMAQECMGIFEKDKLPTIGNVEQNCATGVTSEGKVPKTLVEEMVPILDSRDAHNSNKVRIIALYIQYRDGVPEEDKRRLYQHARLSMPEQDAVNALVHLGLRISRGPGDKDTKKKLKYRPSKDSKDEEYELSRYKPLLTNVLEDQFASRLDSTLFPYVRDQPAPQAAAAPIAPTSSLRSARPVWHRAGAGRGPGKDDNKERVFVFVAGGMTYAEMRECYLVGKKAGKDVYIGSSHAVTPRQFVDDLKVLELIGSGSRALPNGVGVGSANRKTPQQYYDQKYFSQDAPAPRPAQSALPSNPKSGGHRLVSRKQPESTQRPGATDGMGGRTISSSSTGTTGSSVTFADREKEKKKKRGLFHF